MVTINLNFGPEEITRYFERNPASQIYRELYEQTHSGTKLLAGSTADSIGEHIILKLIDLTRPVDCTLSEEIDDYFSLEKMLSHPLNLKNVGAPPYDTLTQRIKEALGEEVVPHLDEHKLLGEYVRILDVILMSVYGNVTQDAPAEIKELLHRDIYPEDGYKVSGSELCDFIAWLEEQEEKEAAQYAPLYTALPEIVKTIVPLREYAKWRNHQYRNVPDGVKPILLPRLYERIRTLADFYNEGKESPLVFGSPNTSINDAGWERAALFDTLNSKFEKKKSHGEVKDASDLMPNLARYLKERGQWRS